MKGFLWFCLLCEFLPVATSKSSNSTSLGFILPPIPPLEAARDCEYTAVWMVAPNMTVASVGMMMDNMCNTTDKVNPTWENWMEWFFSDDATEKVDEIYDFTLSSCTQAFCEQLKWEGNADLAGRGMMITYWLEVSLATFYAVVIFTAWRSTPTVPVSARSIRSQRLHKILQLIQPAATGSAPALLDSMILFSIAMLAAALYAFASAHFTGQGMTSAEWIPVLFMASFSTLPPVLMQCVAQPMWRPKFRTCQWIFIGLLVAAVHIFAATTVSPEIRKHAKNGGLGEVYYRDGDVKFPDGKNTYNEYCSAATEPLQITLKVFRIAAPAVVGILIIACLPWERRFHWAKVLRSAIWVITAILSFISMWTLLSIFSAYRWSQSIHSGASNKERAWGFGQILALAQWIPSMADFVFIFFYGSEAGLQAHMPTTHHVRQVSTHNDHVMLTDSATDIDADTDYKSLLTPYSRSMSHGP
ncbi:hypothetical protein FB567DRAFT_585377 [Paraphoma chrysanthemicola]|uniref:Uncharacterized protein n=1 Tax=Paraphoma chrysanthemicola TaxID=798071 RepID=A0A8K0QSG6_9PLEO|nr:hypothetical protein FB567DRAFT_585377 [Paraphoma chrysanthemicola]